LVNNYSFIKKPARRPVFYYRLSGFKKIAVAITSCQLVPEQQEQRLERQQEQRQEQQRQQASHQQRQEQQQVPEQRQEQQEPGLLFYHRLLQPEPEEQQRGEIVSLSSL
jgi:hypothetical protein